MIDSCGSGRTIKLNPKQIQNVNVKWPKIMRELFAIIIDSSIEL
jgi:hypothetical protein